MHTNPYLRPHNNVTCIRPTFSSPAKGVVLLSREAWPVTAASERELIERSTTSPDGFPRPP